MAANFNRKSLFAEHLKGSSSTSAPRPSRSRDTAESLDDLFGDSSSTPSNRSDKPGRMTVKPW